MSDGRLRPESGRGARGLVDAKNERQTACAGIGWTPSRRDPVFGSLARWRGIGGRRGAPGVPGRGRLR